VTRKSVPVDLPPGAEAIDLGQAVLSCLALEGTPTIRAHPVRPAAFFTDAHRTIYDTMATLADRGEPVDGHTLTDTLRRAGQLDAIGGAAAIAAMIENPLAACTPSSLPDYIRRLEDYGIRRDALARSTDLTAHLQNGHGAGELLAEAEALVATLRRVETHDPAPTVTADGDTLRVAWPTLDVLMTLERARDTSDGPHADVRITRRGQRLHLARLNLMSGHQREAVAKALERKAPALGWRDMLETAADLVVTELRRSSPVVAVVPRPRDPARVLLRVASGPFLVAAKRC
jgi:DnaB helicase-like protein